MPLGTLTLLLLTAATAAPARAEPPAKVIERAKSCVVGIERTTLLPINGEKAGRARATGFIADLKAGIVATNRHVTGTSPARYKVSFRDGSTATARLLYYDPFDDFAFLKVSTAAFGPGLSQAVFAAQGLLAEGSEVFLVGSNEGYEYSVKTGRVVNLAVHKPPRHTLEIQTSFDRTGGSSGSPVFDGKGRVVALHSLGSDTSSFEIPAAYLQDALYMLRSGRQPKRGEPWFKAKPVRLQEALKELKLPPEAAGRILRARPGTKRLLMVEKALPPSGLRTGDVIITAGGAPVGDDSYLLDKILDGAAGGEAELEVLRAGKLLTVKTAVADAQALKVTRFLVFSGGVFEPVTPELRLETGAGGAGAVMLRAERGSPLYRPKSGRLLFTELNGAPIPDLAAFEKAALAARDGSTVRYVALGLDGRDRSPAAGWFTADLKFWPLKAYAWSQAALDWEVTPLP